MGLKSCRTASAQTSGRVDKHTSARLSVIGVNERISLWWGRVRWLRVEEEEHGGQSRDAT